MPRYLWGFLNLGGAAEVTMQVGGRGLNPGSLGFAEAWGLVKAWGARVLQRGGSQVMYKRGLGVVQHL